MCVFAHAVLAGCSGTIHGHASRHADLCSKRIFGGCVDFPTHHGRCIGACIPRILHRVERASCNAAMGGACGIGACCDLWSFLGGDAGLEPQLSVGIGCG